MKITKTAFISLAFAASVGIPLVLLHQTGMIPKPAAPPVKVLAPQVRQAVQARDQAVAPRHYQPPPVPESVRLKVDAIIRRHQGLSKEELLRSEEVQQLLLSFGAKAMGTPEMLRKIEEAAANIQTATGLEHGTMTLDFGEPDSPEFRAWLEAAMSDDPQRAQDWVLNRLDGAAFEFALDPGLKRTSDGVSVAPAKPQAGDKAND